MAAFASRSFTYHTSNETTTTEEGLYNGIGFDETGYVKTETVSGSCGGCGSGGGGSGLKKEYHYLKGAYWANFDQNDVDSNPTTVGDANIVHWITIEDTKDSTKRRRHHHR